MDRGKIFSYFIKQPAQSKQASCEEGRKMNDQELKVSQTPKEEKKRKKTDSDAAELDREQSKRPRTTAPLDESGPALLDRDELMFQCESEAVNTPKIADTVPSSTICSTSTGTVSKTSIQNFFKRVTPCGDGKEKFQIVEPVNVPKLLGVSDESGQQKTEPKESNVKSKEKVVAVVEKHATPVNKKNLGGPVFDIKSSGTLNGIVIKENPGQAAEDRFKDESLLLSGGKDEEKRQTPTISNSLFKRKKRRRTSPQVAVQQEAESDTSVNMESLENSPVKVLENPKLKTTETVTGTGTSENAPVSSSPTLGSASKRPNAFALLMKRKLPAEKATAPHTPCSDECVATPQTTTVSSERSSLPEMMRADQVTNSSVSAESPSSGGEKSVDPKGEVPQSLPGRVNTESDQISELAEATEPLTSVKSIDDMRMKQETVVTTPVCSLSGKGTPATGRRLRFTDVKDEKLSKMLAVLQSVDDGTDDDQPGEPFVITPRTRRSGRKKRNSTARNILTESTEVTEKVSTDPAATVDLAKQAVADEPGALTKKEEEVENINTRLMRKNDTGGRWNVECRGLKATMDRSRYISGSKGACIHYQDHWITPSRFEELAGAKGKKYKVNIKMNGRPLGDSLTDASSNSSRQSSRCSSPLYPAPEPVRKSRSAGKASGSAKYNQEQQPDSGSDKEDKENNGNAENSRRSGRIARKSSLYEEKKKHAEELEKKLKELEKKEKARIKQRKVAIQKQTALKEEIQLSDGESSSSSSEDEEEVVEVGRSGAKKSAKEKAATSAAKQPTGKLAPIFMAAKPKVAEAPEKVAARKAFLFSSTPDVLRREVNKNNEMEELAEALYLEHVFPKENHIQQVCEDSLWRLQSGCGGSWKIRHTCTASEQFAVRPLDCPPGSLSVPRGDNNPGEPKEAIRLSPAEVRLSVGQLKQDHSDAFPTRRLFRRFLERRLESESQEAEALARNIPLAELEEAKRKTKRRSRGNKKGEKQQQTDEPAGCLFETERLSGVMWTKKYQPRTVDDMMSNLREARRLRSWLNNWVTARNRSRSCSSSNSCTSESEYEWSGGESSAWGPGLICGPSGCGKTAAVYAAAAELGLSVLEVNASSSRTGKQVMAVLCEATRSQQVRSAAAQSFFAKKSTAEDQDHRLQVKNNALILLEDVDIVFNDLDEGFYGAVSSLVSQSMRPILMTSSDPAISQTLAKLLKKPIELFSFRAPVGASLRRVGRQLQLLCLAEGHLVSHAAITSLLSSSVSVGQSVLQLQYLVQSALIRPEAVEDTSCKTSGEPSHLESADRDEDELDDDDVCSEEEAAVCDPYFSHIKSARSGRGVAAPAVLQLTTSCSSPHLDWWNLTGLRLTQLQSRKLLFPLESLEDVKNLPGLGSKTGGWKRIDPLQNPHLFSADDQDSDQEGKAVDIQIVESEPVPSASSASIDPRQRTENTSAIRLLAAYLDAVSEFSSESVCLEEEERRYILGLAGWNHWSCDCRNPTGKE